ncbi:hypothetical protein CDD83_9934 [Cordyceps sp. RAO-2017]|nr:hypothetical protein CDD83_9934 [Cordyceps sp. RAO-2017]
MDPSPSSQYIVVGGGTAGLVVASRLSEDPGVDVLVLEAGRDLSEDPRIMTPALWTTLMGSDADWRFRTVSQPGLGDRCIWEPQGKALGGSSAINGQAFIAPGRADIDAWAALGNVGWDWAGLVPFYKKVYTLVPPPDPATREFLGIDWIDDDFRGTSGPIKVSFPGTVSNLTCKAWIDAFRSLNKLTTADPFSGNSVGAYSSLATLDPETKTRSYSGSTHGMTILQRPNVRLLTAAMARKILFAETPAGVRATGVQAEVGGELKTFTASREVIVAAGAFNTPKLLELSGIGRKELLERHAIPVIVDLPGVGEKLQDHLLTAVSYEAADGIATMDGLVRQEPEAVAAAQKLYAEDKAGPLTLGGIQSHAFMPLANFDVAGLLAECPSRPGDEEHCRVVGSIIRQPDQCSAGWSLFPCQVNLHKAKESFLGSQPLPENYISFCCSQAYPFSRGSTHISSADADAAPEIDPCFLSHPADLEIMARQIQSFETLRQTEKMKALLKPNGKRNHPDAFHITSLEGAKKYIRDTGLGTYHSCGTAAMMPRDKEGVVDTRLVVYGTENVRVVDASIFPLIPRGNIVSTVYAVAEKAADIIRGR